MLCSRVFFLISLFFCTVCVLRILAYVAYLLYIYIYFLNWYYYPAFVIIWSGVAETIGAVSEGCSDSGAFFEILIDLYNIF